MEFSTGIPINHGDLEVAREKACILGLTISVNDLDGGGLDTEISFSPIHPNAGNLSKYLWQLQVAFTKKSKF